MAENPLTPTDVQPLEREPGMHEICHRCGTKKITRTPSNFQFDENGYFSTVTVRCVQGHERTERVPHTAPSRVSRSADAVPTFSRAFDFN